MFKPGNLILKSERERKKKKEKKLMEKIQKIVVTLVLFLIIIVCSSSDSKITPEDTSSSTPFSPVAKFKSQWFNLVNRLQSYFFLPPNLDFRGSSSPVNVDDAKATGGAGEKVKEAVTKSLEKSKTAVEDSAKSAANLAKQTFSQHPQPEL